MVKKRIKDLVFLDDVIIYLSILNIFLFRCLGVVYKYRKWLVRLFGMNNLVYFFRLKLVFRNENEGLNFGFKIVKLKI